MYWYWKTRCLVDLEVGSVLLLVSDAPLEPYLPQSHWSSLVMELDVADLVVGLIQGDDGFDDVFR